MPFLEVFHFDLSPTQRSRVAQGVTAGLATAFEISPDIISTYFINFPADAYAHAGVLPASRDNQRIFIKIHAFQRPVSRRRAASVAITAAVSAAAGTAPANIAIYFMPRDGDEVAHAGRLFSDEQAEAQAAAQKAETA